MLQDVKLHLTNDLPLFTGDHTFMGLYPWSSAFQLAWLGPGGR